MRIVFIRFMNSKYQVCITEPFRFDITILAEFKTFNKAENRADGPWYNPLYNNV